MPARLLVIVTLTSFGILLASPTARAQPAGSTTDATSLGAPRTAPRVREPPSAAPRPRQPKDPKLWGPVNKGLGLTIKRVRWHGNTKTKTETLIRVARVPIGHPLTQVVIDRIKRDLLGSIYCRWVLITWEIIKNDPTAVVLFIQVKEKISWFIAPIFSYSSGNYGGSIAFGEKNLLGLGKQLRVRAGFSNEAQSFHFSYRDPNIKHGNWAWWMGIDWRRSSYADFDPSPEGIRAARLLRLQSFQEFSPNIGIGVRIKDIVDLSLSYRFTLIDFNSPRCLRARPDAAGDRVYQRCPHDPTAADLAPGALGFSHYVGPLALRDGLALRDSTNHDAEFWKWRRDAAVSIGLSVSRIHRIEGMHHGFIIGTRVSVADKYLGGQFGYVGWKVAYFHSWVWKKRHNLSLELIHEGTYDAPYFRDLRIGGTSLRGYVSQQFQGDILNTFRFQYQLHMFRIWWLHFRLVAFYDTAWVFFRDGGRDQAYVRETSGSLRYHLPYTPGWDSRTSWNNGVGGGLRVWIKGFAIDNLGVDVAYGIEAREVRVVVMLGK